MAIDVRYVTTKDDLKLVGFHYDSGKKEVCVLLIHGMSGYFLENYFGHVLGETLNGAGRGYIYSHNRGYTFINDIKTNKTDEKGGVITQRHGATYERFEDSVWDIDAWIKEAKNLGYKKIVLMGHSLGCNKIIHYLYKNPREEVVGVVLASPPDMVADTKNESGESYEKQNVQALKNVAEGNPRKLLDGFVFGDSFIISSQTYLDIAIDNCPGDNLPIMRNPMEFPELSSIKQPILCFGGEYDGIFLKPPQEYFGTLKEKAKSCSDFTTAIITGANHGYDTQEGQMAKVVCEWVDKLT